MFWLPIAYLAMLKSLEEKKKKSIDCKEKDEYHFNRQFSDIFAILLVIILNIIFKNSLPKWYLNVILLKH